MQAMITQLVLGVRSLLQAHVVGDPQCVRCGDSERPNPGLSRPCCEQPALPNAYSTGSCRSCRMEAGHWKALQASRS